MRILSKQRYIDTSALEPGSSQEFTTPFQRFAWYDPRNNSFTGEFEQVEPVSFLTTYKK